MGPYQSKTSSAYLFHSPTEVYNAVAPYWLYQYNTGGCGGTASTLYGFTQSPNPCPTTNNGPCSLGFNVNSGGGQSGQEGIVYVTSGTYVSPTGPANSTCTGGTCTCNAGYQPSADGTACNLVTCPSAGALLGPSGDSVWTLPSETTSLCYNGCSGTAIMAATASDGQHYVWGPFAALGTKCDAAWNGTAAPAQSASSPSADPTQPGTCYAVGTVNGVATYVPQPCTSTQATSTSTTTASSTSASGVSSPGATSTTSTTTKCSGGLCTTTTTTTTANPDGSSSESTATASKPDDSATSKCKDNPSSSGCGGAGAATSGLYTAKGVTLTSVLSDFRTAALGTPLGSATGSFFTVAGGGTCPTFTSTIPYINATVTIDQFCSSFAATVLSIFKAAFLVVCSFFAFRVAIE